jgi:hypothetical protein
MCSRTLVFGTTFAIKYNRHADETRRPMRRTKKRWVKPSNVTACSPWCTCYGPARLKDLVGYDALDLGTVTLVHRAVWNLPDFLHEQASWQPKPR